MPKDEEEEEERERERESQDVWLYYMSNEYVSPVCKMLGYNT